MSATRDRKPVTAEDLARLAALTADLDDPEVMDAAWRCADVGDEIG